MISDNVQAQPTSKLYRLIVADNLASRLDEFLLSCQAADLSPATVKDYRWFVGHFLSFCQTSGISRLEDIIPNHIRLYLVQLKDKHKPSSVHGHYRHLRRFFNYLAEEEIIPKSPMATVHPPRVPKVIIQPFSQQQIRDLLLLCNDSTLTGARNKALILLLLDTGLRKSEAAGLDLADIDIEKERIKVMGKGAKERIVRIGKGTQRALVRYAVKRRDLGFAGPWLWVSYEGKRMTPGGLSMIMRVLGKRAGMSGVRCSLHTFRHTFATQALINGADRWAVQSLLGHEKDAMTRHYQETIRNSIAAEEHARFSPVDRMRLE